MTRWRRKIASYKLKMDRIDYWLSVGAQPSDTARDADPQGGRRSEAGQGAGDGVSGVLSLES